MMEGNDNLEMAAGDPADVLLRQLLHLKKYETPDAVRMTRHKRNIMRQVREASHRKRWNLGDLLEINIPWFFAEPRYGMALLFIVFAGLQFWGANSRKQQHDQTGIYTSHGDVAMFEPAASVSASASTNRISYPKLPGDLELFPGRQGDGGVKFVGRLEGRE